MKTKEIIDRVLSLDGIGSLNPMQQAMASDESRNLMLIAPTGSGKTIAFAIRMLRNMDSGMTALQAVVIAPTRELVLQIADVLRSLAAGLKCVALYGGHSMTDEINSLSVIPNIIVATPGRLVDHLHRHTIDIAKAKTIVLDEFDKSLQLGFLDQMRRIVKAVRRPSLRMLTSATMLAELPQFMGGIEEYKLYDYSQRAVDPRESTNVIEVRSPIKDKIETLTQLLRSLDNQKVIIFVNHRESAQRIYDRLHADAFPAGIYHGALDQQQRRLAVQLLANGTAPILVATDLAARGLDIPEIGAVIHYHLPIDDETWTHRNGRTARQGAEGNVYAILSEGEALPAGTVADEVVTELAPSAHPIVSRTATLYINAGKKEKISKGDVAGYIMQKGGLTKDEVGLITLDDHYAIVAVPRGKASAVLAAVAPHRLKNQRVKVTLLR